MANVRTPSQVQKNGQITIPIKICRKLGFQAGDLVAFIEIEQS
jgi:AbrB family looped-hinge helix DNA binding protein